MHRSAGCLYELSVCSRRVCCVVLLSDPRIKLLARTFLSNLRVQSRGAVIYFHVALRSVVRPVLEWVNMLYVLSQPRAPNPPSPWDSILCDNASGTNEMRRSWPNGRRPPPRVRFRSVSFKVDVSRVAICSFRSSCLCCGCCEGIRCGSVALWSRSASFKKLLLFKHVFGTCAMFRCDRMISLLIVNIGHKMQICQSSWKFFQQEWRQLKIPEIVLNQT